MQSCYSGECNGFPQENDLQYFIQIDSLNNDSIKQINYAGGGKVLYPNSRIAQFYFTPSKPFTVMYITTFNQIDTLIFDNNHVYNYVLSGSCRGDKLIMTTRDDIIVKHTFDSIYFSNFDQYYYPDINKITKTLHVRLR